MSIIHLYDTYRAVSQYFVKPKLHCKLGLWKNDPCLPVWRRGPILRLVRYKNIGINRLFRNSWAYQFNGELKAYKVIDNVTIVNGKSSLVSSGKTYTYDTYKTCYHKLPEGLKRESLVWNRNIRKKLKKYHLSWIKPEYQLPMWLSFHIFNHDVYYKTKWSDIRYEFPPQFTIVIFGISLSFWLSSPIKEHEDFYWESLLNARYPEKGELNLEKMVTRLGWYTKAKDNKTIYMVVRRDFLKPEYQFYWDYAVAKLKTKHPELTIN